jgi:succinoglycan biosynthesis protein ExoM
MTADCSESWRETMGGVRHISVCICTYKRPHLLRRLLVELEQQETDDLFTYSAVVVDNDQLQSAEPAVKEYAANCRFPIKYCVESQQNIALARNRAIQNAQGDLIAFIDDDEFPTRRWLVTLYAAMEKYKADGALGPVKPHFDNEPPAWVVAGKFYDRPSYPTGLVIDWKKGRTGNVLFDRKVLNSLTELFRPEFRTGEDQDFFRRLIEKGHSFVWCHEALAYEVVPPTRWGRRFMLRRALLRGATSRRHANFGLRDVLKSMLAVPAYLAALPVSLLMGHGRYMIFLVKLCDHLGKLLAVLGINPIREQYVTE